MLLSLAYMLLIGFALGRLCKLIKLPSLVGMIITGILLGPNVLNLIDFSILNSSTDLRQIALIIILLRAGLSLDMNALKQVGRPAILMCFLPACFEIIAMVLLAPRLLGLSLIDSAVLGAVIGAVSPAVIVPKMIHLNANNYGTKKSIPSLILAGASVDDVFVIVMFTSFLNLAIGEKTNYLDFIQIPIIIIFGILIGYLAGLLLHILVKKFCMRDTVKVATLLCLSFLLLSMEIVLKPYLPFSALIAVMTMGISLQKYNKEVSERMSIRFNKLWVIAEVILFVLVGASLSIDSALDSSINAFILVLLVLLLRMLGVLLCLLKTNLNIKERIFCMIAYLPKATVQAAIGGIPLSRGLATGNVILTVAVVSILITAPLGALLIDISYKKLLNKDD